VDLSPDLRPTRAEIDLDCIGHNVNEFRRLLGPEVQIMAVVKAGGYGHGAVEAARAALAAGATALAVAFQEEGVELRCAGITAPVLLLGYTEPCQAPQLVEHHLTPVVFDWEAAEGLSRRLVGQGARLPVHVKVDTGMGRLGVAPGEAVEFAARVAALPGLALEGLLTHFAAADDDGEGAAFTETQLRRFDQVVAGCRQRGLAIAQIHAANSAAAAAYPRSRYNLVRLGLTLYGCYPAGWLEESAAVRLQPVLAFKSRLVLVKDVPAGTPISYGCTYRTGRQAVIGTVPVGYADGYSRGLSNRGEVLVRGRRAPVVGRVCMDQFMVDLTDIPGAARGDEVVLYGRQGDEAIPVEAVAGALGTISYEVLCALGKRVPRVYLREGRVAAVRDILGEKIFEG
jgi:alanine racemase